MGSYRCACALVVLLACGGCRMCQSHTDHLPPVLDGPYSTQAGRAGSVDSLGTWPVGERITPLPPDAAATSPEPEPPPQ